MEPVALTLSVNEINALLQFIDLGVRSRGLAVAGDACALSAKLAQAAQAAQAKVELPKEEAKANG